MLAFSTMLGIGCGPRRNGGDNVDANKTQLYIATYGGGYGTSFLKDLKERFEEHAKDVVYENGKTGAQILYIADKDRYTASSLKDKIEYDQNELFFITGDDLFSYLDGNKLLEITDIVKEKIPGEEKSIEDKLRPEMKEHHNVGDKYYSLPFVDSGAGLSYNVSVFEDYELYFAKGGCPSEYLRPSDSKEGIDAKLDGAFSSYAFVGADAEKSAGPDGKYGTNDDGLPATLVEFNQLIDRMIEVGVDSIIWSATYETAYSPFLPRAFRVNHHGLAESSINSNAGGTEGTKTKIITSFTNGVPNVEERLIKKENLKDVLKQEGFYYGLQLFEKMLKSESYSKHVKSSLSHVETQEMYLASPFTDGEKPIAFLLDGCWWENEADSANTFDRLKNDFGDAASRANARFGYFPMPWFDDSRIGDKYTMSGGGGSILVKKDFPQEKYQLLKDFLQFALTDESLMRQTVNMGLPAPYVYEMDDKANPNSYYNQMSYFTRNYFEIYKSSDIVYGFTSRELSLDQDIKNINEIISYMSSKTVDNERYGTFPNGILYPNAAFNGTEKEMTAKTFFEGLYRSA